VQFSDEVKERLEILKSDMKYSIYDVDCCAIFMSATNQLKEAYVQLNAGYRNYNELTIMHTLHLYHLRFLELDARWVGALIEAEEDMKDEDGNCNLMFLFRSEKFYDFDFRCRRF